ncbi:FAD-binding oxidoreductase [Chloroflexota bacterium]
MANINQLQAELVRQIGPDWIDLKGSSLIVQPQTTEEVAAVLHAANRTKTPVRPKGGGTGWWSSTRPLEHGILLQLTRMNDILKVDEDVMTVTMQAGITFSKLEEALGPKGYRVRIFPESGRVATVGGHIQTWGTSPHTSSVFEDQATQILGLKVVLPTGEIFPTGTNAVTTAAGQFHRRFFPADLSGLFIGSEGAFGVITEATLKLYRQPEANLTRLVGFHEFGAVMSSLRQMQQAQRAGGLLTLIEQRLVSKRMLLTAVPRLQGIVPEEVKVLLVLRTEGDKTDAQSHLARACDLSRSSGGRIIEDDVPEWWAGRYGAFSSAVLGKGPKVMIVAMVPFRLMLEAFSIAEKFGAKYGLNLEFRGYPFGGPVFLAHATIPWEATKPKSHDRALAQGRDFMEALVRIGSVPHRVGTDFLPVLVGKLDPAYYEFVRRIKKMLDPNGIMNPGVIVGLRDED